MKVAFVVLLLAVLTAFAAAAFVAPLSEETHRSLFESWKAKHGRMYFSAQEEEKRFQVFASNIEKIRNHNARNVTYTVSMNKFGDLTSEEFRASVLSSLKPNSAPAPSMHVRSSVGVPDSFDWRKQTPSPVTGVKDQGQCGSCWQFSATGAIEGAWALSKKIAAVSLSEQQGIDCDVHGDDQGCDGGWMDGAFNYTIAAGGLESEASYPYTASDGKCKFNKAKIVASISSYKDVAPKSEADLTDAIATAGPVSIAVMADAFQFYDSGILSYSDCEATQDELDHGVLVVGYTPTYWIVKNSWGKSWGEEGYIRLERKAGDNVTSNTCGILFVPSYPVV